MATGIPVLTAKFEISFQAHGSVHSFILQRMEKLLFFTAYLN
jgi:hypothetical protein